MRQSRFLILFFLLIFLVKSCIIPYDPKIEGSDINKYVVSGQISNSSEIQTITISRASAIGSPEYLPVAGCNVIVYDDKWRQYEMAQTIPGTYQGVIESKYMYPGAAFKLRIITPDETLIESDFDIMTECPGVDSVYYEVKKYVPVKPGDFSEEIQFYIDLDGESLNSRFYKWEIIETWEYHAYYPRQWYYDGHVNRISPPDYSRMICWKTQMVPDIYTLSTMNLSENRYSGLSIHTIDNKTPKMLYGYSMLINQYSLSENAYSYWDQMRTNSSEMGGLYERQPLSITGNLHNLNDPEQEILGFFSAALCKSKRIFIQNIPDFAVDYSGHCNPAVLERGGFLEISPYDYPVYLLGDDERFYMVTLSDECVDCLTMGGTNVKPDFWPF